MENILLHNKYNIEIPIGIVQSYFHRLINRYFAILALYEGRSFDTKQVIYTAEEAYSMYLEYVKNFTTELCGISFLFEDNEYFLVLLAALEYLQIVKIDQHKLVKTKVFECINICKKLEMECKEYGKL